MAEAVALDSRSLIASADYANLGYPHDIWTWLRAEDPVRLFRQESGPDFWAITRHADIMMIGKHPETFLNGPRLVITERDDDDDVIPPTLIQLDPPKHGIYRQLISKRFTPRYLRTMHDDIERIGKEIVDALVSEGEEGECDFVERVSAPLPIAVIAWMLGVPREDWELLFDWTNRTIGADDPEYQQEGLDGRATAQQAMQELFLYFTKMIEDKRKNPGDDLVTLFTQCEVDGQKLSDMDVLLFCFIIVVAGNETTRNGTTGGMLTFIEHQDEMRRLQADPSLLAPAVEEVVRWTSPIIHFGRTATEDVEIRGRKIREGDTLALFYPSANRDEEVFEDPFTFRIDRHPNHHLGFGVGEHFCLGSHVAKLEMQVAYKYLLPRIEEIELGGPISRLHSGLVGGVKRLPIRYRLKRL